ncbi:conserved hypothetical protein [Solidesulfovibrio fructosivorans JJ]]|uniref:Uncharacterized protein n=1 Tax=Solidesulfovibrio fructosivorans JJ] TaxID=596151 RepID=E1K2J5_SOLFR|nr:hypothetical protein [Solidesulfovibrio fructosivorans]EFL49160.1 conserved hypothetical protein [Solidesulfovibrio fructosivorans JJ]]
MGRAIIQLNKRKKAIDLLRSITDNQEHSIIIHYSCESFYERNDGSSPRITSIAVRNCYSAQTTSFSIHQIAEINSVPMKNIPGNYDRLEKMMLDRFYDYVRRHDGYKWLHWNMRDINYGFPAISHRYSVLKGTPETIPEDKMIDIARLLISIYGPAYIGHPRLVKLIQKNMISDKDFLSGQDEALAFEQGKYVELHQSTLRKVDIMSNIISRAADNSLKINTRMCENFKLYPVALGELFKEHWFFSIILSLCTILGFIFGIPQLFH